MYAGKAVKATNVRFLVVALALGLSSTGKPCAAADAADLGPGKK